MKPAPAVAPDHRPTASPESAAAARTVYKWALFPAVLFVLLVASLVGCAAPQQASGPDAETLDLRARNRVLEHEVDLLRDSIAVVDFTLSGEMDREFRRIQNEIDRMTYLLQVCRDGGEEVAVLAVDRLFEPSSPNLTLGGKRLIDSVAVLLNTEAEYRIEGHSDSTAPGPATAIQYPTNWELSAARASAVTRRLIDYHGIRPDRVRAVSYGAARPAFTNTTRAGRARNRRIRITAIQELGR